MFEILEKRVLNPQTFMFKIKAPDIAKSAGPGQFIIIRPSETGERIPLTIEDHDENEGSISIVFQAVGYSTSILAQFEKGDFILDVVGPLGKRSEIDGYKKVAVVGGGLGCAIAYPQSKYLHESGAEVDIIAGFRNKDVIILEEEMKKVSTNLYICTDDGSNGTKGFVTDVLKNLLDSGKEYDLVIAIGPLIMMKFVSKLTKEYGIKTIVSMNPIMLDGTGMCGACRVTVGGKTKFACVDGPDFDGHEIDFDEAMVRSGMYKRQEKVAAQDENCRLLGGEGHE